MSKSTLVRNMDDLSRVYFRANKHVTKSSASRPSFKLTYLIKNKNNIHEVKEVTFVFNEVEMNGPKLPFKHMVGMYDVGPQVPIVSTMFTEGTPNYDMFMEIHRKINAAMIIYSYNFNGRKDVTKEHGDVIDIIGKNQQLSKEDEKLYSVAHFVYEDGETVPITKSLINEISNAGKIPFNYLHGASGLNSVLFTDLIKLKENSFKDNNFYIDIKIKTEKFGEKRISPNEADPKMHDPSYWGFNILESVYDENSKEYLIKKNDDWLLKTNCVTKNGVNNRFIGHMELTIPLIYPPVGAGNKMAPWYTATFFHTQLKSSRQPVPSKSMGYYQEEDATNSETISIVDLKSNNNNNNNNKKTSPMSKAVRAVMDDD